MRLRRLRRDRPGQREPTHDGVRALADNGKVRVLAFLARTTQRYVEDRIGLDGTAGPFKLSQKRVIPGSETVRVVTASPIDPGDETSSVELAAGLDYLISYVSGEITLRRPMSAFGDGLEQRHLRVSYETDDEMADGVTAGFAPRSGSRTGSGSGHRAS